MRIGPQAEEYSWLAGETDVNYGSDVIDVALGFYHTLIVCGDGTIATPVSPS